MCSAAKLKAREAMKKLSKKTSAKNIDEYLALVPNEESRATLKKLRRTIKAIVPDAVETISYQIPTFKYNGRMLVSFAAFAEHCSLFPGAGPIEIHRNELKSYETSKGTIRFSPRQPMPAPLVKKLIKTGMSLIDAKTRRY
jgi:uncharacterized protein YdhG (YjbR/CyaY superfamily)